MEDTKKVIPVISTTWSDERVAKFFHNLKKGKIFGFSGAFKPEDIRGKAESYGIKVVPVPESHLFRKRWGDYVLKVSIPYKKTAATNKKIVSDKKPRSVFLGTDVFCVNVNNKSRKCSCGAKIKKDEVCFALYKKTITYIGRSSTIKEYYCLDCGNKFIQEKIKSLCDLKKCFS